MRRLRFRSAGNEFNAQEKESPEWQSRLSELMRALASWGPSDEKSEEDYFHQKCVIYDALINSIPADNQYDGLRDELLRDFTSMLSNSPLQKVKPTEWFLHAKILIDRTNAAKLRERDKLVSLNTTHAAPFFICIFRRRALEVCELNTQDILQLTTSIHEPRSAERLVVVLPAKIAVLDLSHNRIWVQMTQGRARKFLQTQEIKHFCRWRQKLVDRFDNKAALFRTQSFC